MGERAQVRVEGRGEGEVEEGGQRKITKARRRNEKGREEVRRKWKEMEKDERKRRCGEKKGRREQPGKQRHPEMQEGSGQAGGAGLAGAGAHLLPGKTA